MTADPDFRDSVPDTEDTSVGPDSADQGRLFTLRVRPADGPGWNVASHEGRIVVGRSPNADLTIPDPSVSPLHCEVVAEGDGYVLRDLGSHSGTWLGGLRVREVFLPAEARIGVGDVEVAFCLTGAPVAPAPSPDAHFGELIGESAAMRVVFSRLAKLAPRDTTVLLEGESGTGKELAAAAIHQASPRCHKPFVVVDCASIARTLIESELFGHERGSYTGASHSRVGAFVRANGGTVFLDEVGELDIELQPRLLRVLESREVKPVGASAHRAVDVRIIAATNRDLRREVNRGTFREDLYYRLAIACVRLPPLRERREDIPLIARHLLHEHSRRDGVAYSLEDVLPGLVSRSWPGNVRELKNSIERIVALGDERDPDGVLETPAASRSAPFKVAKAEVVGRFERDYLVAVLAEQGGNITAAARVAELDRVHFLRLLDRYGLRPSRALRM
jgi:transcriptional regulator with GAF, ATPase, and Fis domain